jgi:hypothetical protein
MGAFKIKLDGMKELREAMQSRLLAYPKKVKAALVLEAEIIMTDSKQNYCPVKDGILKGSGHVEVDENRVSVTLAYGGAAGAYAARQHEELDYHHTVGEAKYLEKPLMAAMPTLTKNLAVAAPLK